MCEVFVLHISEGILSAPVLAGGAALTLAALAFSLKQINVQDVPKTAMLCAVFFVASLVHVPLGPGSVHLVLAGLLGAILGWGAFVALFVALLLQAVLFQFGGLTTLGINTFIMATPAVFLFMLLGRFLTAKNRFLPAAAAFLIGAGSLLGSGLLAALALFFSGSYFGSTAKLIFLAHLPLAVVEGLITFACVQFLRKVKPDILPQNLSSVSN